jgi:hypothetical protein
MFHERNTTVSLTVRGEMNLDLVAHYSANPIPMLGVCRNFNRTAQA